MLVSVVQDSNSVFLKTLLHYGLLQDRDYNSLCCRAAEDKGNLEGILKQKDDQY